MHRGAGVISFEAGNNTTNLYLYDLTAQTTSRFPQYPIVSFTTTWSPDGSRVFFARIQGDDYGLYMMRLSDFHVERLPADNDFMVGVVAWSPDSRWLAIVKQSGLYVYDMNALPPTYEQFPVSTTLTNLDWSPDSTRMALIGWLPSTMVGSHLLVYDVNLHTLQYLIPPIRYVEDVSVAWSPDGSQIAFTRQQSDPMLMVMNTDGSRIRSIPSAEIRSFAQSVWTPGGRWLLIEGEYDGTSGLLMVDTLTGESRLWVVDSQLIAGPSFAPNGSDDLLYAGYYSVDLGSQLFVIHTRTDQEIHLLPISIHGVRNPQWVPW
ncbi:MAG: hypothetical protein U0670_02290 [Anaerolineae bacterium]